MILDKNTQIGKGKFVSENTLWKNFSKYIRLRDVVLVRSPEEAYCRCITCGKLIHWKYQAEAGHCYTRDRKLTKYEETNVHAQCTECNNFKKGDQGSHVVRIIEKYGKKEQERLEALSTIRGARATLSLVWIDKQNSYYRAKVKKISKSKGINIKRY